MHVDFESFLNRIRFTGFELVIFGCFSRMFLHHTNPFSPSLPFLLYARNNMFELADRLVGIYKTNDATKSVTINPRLFEKAVGGGLPGLKETRMPLGDATNTV